MMGVALRCVRPQFQWYQLALCHINKDNSIARLYQRVQPKDSILYITLHYITLPFMLFDVSRAESRRGGVG